MQYIALAVVVEPANISIKEEEAASNSLIVRCGASETLLMRTCVKLCSFALDWFALIFS